MKEMSLMDVQHVCLDLMQELHDFCVKNNIRYSLCAGSLLGAIRHNGFIPWDDDIDVLMPRSDYDKFVHTFKSTKGNKLYSRDIEECRNKSGYPYARLREMNKTYVDAGCIPWCIEEGGLFLDIYPCDGAPSNIEEARKYIRRNMFYARISHYSLFSRLPWSFAFRQKTKIQKLKVIIKKIIAMFIPDKLYDDYCRLRSTYSLDNSEYYIASSHYKIKEWQPKKNIESFQLHKFEDRQFFIMTGYDDNLKRVYGDYMNLPPENERITHHLNKYYWK